MSVSHSTIQVENSYRNIIRLALPVAIAIFIPQINLLTNTLFLGYYTPLHSRFDTQSMLAASGIAGIFYLTMVMIGYGIASGLLMLMSRKAGENDKQGLASLFTQGMWLSLSISLVLISISYLLAPYIFQLGLQDESIRESAISFIFIRCWGLPFILLAQLGNSFFLSTSYSKMIIAGSLVQTIINILFDYFLIFGHGPFPELGLNGTAWASILSEMGFAATSYSIIIYRREFREYALRFFSRPDRSILWPVLQKSSPLILQYFLSIGAWEFFFIYVEHIGKAESAISQVLRSVFGLVGIAAWALASTCNSMVSNLIGQGLSHQVIPVIHRIVILSLSVALFLGIPLILFPYPFLSILTSDSDLAKVGVDSLRIVVVATWMLSVSTIYFNGLIGTGNTKLTMYFELIAIVLYLIYTYTVVEVLHLSLPFAWASEFTYWFSLFSLSAFYIYSGRWKRSL